VTVAKGAWRGDHGALGLALQLCYQGPPGSQFDVNRLCLFLASIPPAHLTPDALSGLAIPVWIVLAIDHSTTLPKSRSQQHMRHASTPAAWIPPRCV